MKELKNFIGRQISACAGILVAWACLTTGAIGHAQTTASNLSPDLQEIVKFAQAHMTDDVILAYIKNSGKTYTVSADDMLYLNSQGVSQPVLSALLQAKSAAAPVAAPVATRPPATPMVPPPSTPAPAPPVAMVAPPTPTFDYFQAQLTPYGHWIDVPEVGACWVPVEAWFPGWRPYVNSGHWEYTDAGWYWRSDYAWGEIAFHYGRWINDARTGFVWAWAPQYDWAPSWVCWRYDDADGCLGWAPLPWDARFRAGIGLEWRGGVAVDVDFGLGVDAFVFIGRDHFWDHDYARVLIGRDEVRRFYGHSEIHNGYRVDHGRFVAEGWGHDRVASFTHHEVEVHPAHDLRGAEERHNLEARQVQHPEIAARPEERGRPGFASPTPGHSGAPGANKVPLQPKPKAGPTPKKPEDEKKP